MIKIRVDVDYPYPSRTRSFIHTALNLPAGKDYLKNSKIVAKMINQTRREVKAYWFFTPKTIPDHELLQLIDNPKHEVELHIVNDPVEELRLLEKKTGKKTNYYTIHGTARLLARIMWKRWRSKAPKIRADFPLQSFHQFPTTGIDSLCYTYGPEEALRLTKERIRAGDVIYFHPIWLFQRGVMNRRGPFYGTLKNILEVDKELETLVIRKKGFAKISSDSGEYAKDIVPTSTLIEKLVDRRIDIFTFIERKWCYTIPKPSNSWMKTEDNIALLQVTTYDEWWRNVGKKTRNLVRKAEKSGIKTEIVEPNEKLAEGMWKVFNETPIRQGRAFPHYGVPLQNVKCGVLSAQNCTFIGAFVQGELAGFIQLVRGDKIAIISQILSLQRHSDKAVNNALIAKAVEVCEANQTGWIMYGRMGNHPSLDNFKQSNGFTRQPLTRYYVPITRKGRIAVKIGLHREFKDALPEAIKSRLFPFYNWVSRTKMRARLRFGAG